MKKVQSIVMVVFMVLALFCVASADWNPGDNYKMHFAQLPDPSGWDIEIASIDLQHECADDWICTETGPVSDIHFWTSWQGDYDGIIQNIEIRIYDDDRSGPYSKPGNLLWSQTFDQTQFNVVDPYGFGTQGFADPQQGFWGWIYPDHQRYEQVNIDPIQEPFIQQAGNIYWLAIHVWWQGTQASVGWKTADVTRYPSPYTGGPFEDTAVFRQITGGWEPLISPDGIELDLAFVITGEPEEPTIFPVEETICPRIVTNCPADNTRCPTVITECPSDYTVCGNDPTWCPIIRTECPEIPTMCPERYTTCPEVVTVCPEIPTQCSIITECPQQVTECFVEPTWCPYEWTFCPGGPTLCPEIHTVCPDSTPTVCKLTLCPQEETLCPENDTFCPLAPTICPADQTICGPITSCPLHGNTICPDVPTICPTRWTFCPELPTQCPVIDTICYNNDPTLCAVDSTNCPDDMTWCPEVPTFCPQVDTFCPDNLPTICEITQCPDLQTMCPIDPTTCPLNLPTVCPEVVTECPVIVTECLTEPTMCTLNDADQDGVDDCNDNCPNHPNGPSQGTCTLSTPANLIVSTGQFCTADADCDPGEFCEKVQADNYPPGGNSIGDACDCEANFNCDTNVDATDVAAFLADFGRSIFFNPCSNPLPCDGDFLCDVDVDAHDVDKFLEDFGRSTFFLPCPICSGAPWCSYP